MDPVVLLSFDAEEFDLPLEYGADVDRETQIDVGAEGLERTLELLGDVGVRATLFTTGVLAEAAPELVRRAAVARHEIASHAWRHTGFEDADAARSRKVLSEISGQDVRGFRRPRMEPTDPGLLLGAGYRYDACGPSIWLPGRYNRLREPRLAHVSDDGLVRIPASVTPVVRWPLFWLSFKNTPERVSLALTRSVLRSDGYAALYFHPWELCDLSGFRLPGYVRRPDGERLRDRLVRYLSALAGEASFITYGEFARQVPGRACAGERTKEAPTPALAMERMHG